MQKTELCQLQRVTLQLKKQKKRETKENDKMSTAEPFQELEVKSPRTRQLSKDKLDSPVTAPTVTLL